MLDTLHQTKVYKSIKNLDYYFILHIQYESITTKLTYINILHTAPGIIFYKFYRYSSINLYENLMKCLQIVCNIYYNVTLCFIYKHIIKLYIVN